MIMMVVISQNQDFSLKLKVKTKEDAKQGKGGKCKIFGVKESDIQTSSATTRSKTTEDLKVSLVPFKSTNFVFCCIESKMCGLLTSFVTQNVRLYMRPV